MSKPFHPGGGIRVDFIGASGPFSRTGKSTSHLVIVWGAHYIIDLGGPLFKALGPEGLCKLRGAIATHSHEDHRRWFTDVALFMRYSPACPRPLRLMTTAAIHEEWEKDSRAALMRTLTGDSRRVVDVPYDSFVEKIQLGPSARFRIASVKVSARSEARQWRVIDENDESVDPSRAKVVINSNPSANRPRMLFCDEKTEEWIEPEYFYTFEDQRFYHAEQNVFVDSEARLSIRAIKSPAWHGPSIFSVECVTPEQRLLFTSDTVYDTALWHALAEQKRKPNYRMARKEFESSPLVYGDINEFLERTWSAERLEQALDAYRDGCVVHDVDYDGSVVHTSYSALKDLPRERLLLTHSPDRFVSQIPLARERKSYLFLNDEVQEICGQPGEERLHPYAADLFVKHTSRSYVGFESPRGKYKLIHRNGRLEIPFDGDCGSEPILARYDLYVDLDGKYLPMLSNAKSQRYERRLDGQVELVEETSRGSVGRVIRDLRERLESSRIARVVRKKVLKITKKAAAR
ncbi:MAG: hypothetical protein ACR2L2_03780 [Acidobacteriota bacterium]